MRILTICILFVCGLHLIDSQAKNCYQCAVCGCDDPFQKDFTGVSQVPSASGWCLKARRNENGKVTITRLSSILPQKENNCEETTGSNFKTTTCYCNSDLCNDAASPKLSSMSVCLFVIFWIVSVFQRIFE